MRLLITIILSLLILTSCSSNKYRRSGSLSNAMEKASDEHEGDRNIDAVEYDDDDDENHHHGHHHGHDGQNDGEQYQEQQTSGFMTFEKETEPFAGKDNWMGLQYGTGVLSCESFYGLQSFALAGNVFWRSRKSVSWELGCDYAPLQTTATAEFDPAEDDIAKALDGGIFSAFIGASYRYYTTPKYTFLGNYLSAGARVHSMFWKYKNTIYLDVYDEEDDYEYRDAVNYDQLWGLDLNVASGLNVMQFDHFKLGIEFNPGIIIWWIDTYEGFTNDVFAPFLYFKTNFRFYLGG